MVTVGTVPAEEGIAESQALEKSLAVESESRQ